MTVAVKERLRRVRRIERRWQERGLGLYTVLSDGETHYDSMTGKTLSDEDIERLRRRGYRLLWRMVPPGLIDGI